MRNGAALAEIESAYRDGFDRFCRVAAAIVGDREAARDVVQDAFARAVRRRATYTGNGPLEGWLWRILVNAAHDQRRAVAARSVRERAQGTARIVEPGAEHTALQAAVAELPERQRLVLFLRFYADLDYEAIAAALAITPGTVGATLNAVRTTLRRRLEEVPA